MSTTLFVIRFPLKYPLLINLARSLGLCSATQLGSLTMSLTLWGTQTMEIHNVFLGNEETIDK